MKLTNALVTEGKIRGKKKEKNAKTDVEKGRGSVWRNNYQWVPTNST